MKKIYVDLTNYIKGATVLITDDCSCDRVQTKTVSCEEILSLAREHDAEEIYLVGSSEFAEKMQENIDKLVKIEYNNDIKQIKTYLGGF